MKPPALGTVTEQHVSLLSKLQARVDNLQAENIALAESLWLALRELDRRVDAS